MAFTGRKIAPPRGGLEDRLSRLCVGNTAFAESTIRAVGVPARGVDSRQGHPHRPPLSSGDACTRGCPPNSLWEEPDRWPGGHVSQALVARMWHGAPARGHARKPAVTSGFLRLVRGLPSPCAPWHPMRSHPAGTKTIRSGTSARTSVPTRRPKRSSSRSSGPMRARPPPGMRRCPSAGHSVRSTITKVIRHGVSATKECGAFGAR